MDEAQLILTVIGIILTSFLGIVTTLLLFIIRGQKDSIKDTKDSLGREIGEVKTSVKAHDDKLSCIDRKLARVTTVMVMLLPEEAKKLLKENSPLKIQPGDEANEIEAAVTLYLDEVEKTE